MRRAKKERLEAAGWRVGDAAEFLSLSKADSTLIEIRLHLAKELKKRRISCRLTQNALALRIGSSQSRVAKMEAGDPSVSLDLLIRTLLASGSSGSVIADAFVTATSPERKVRTSRITRQPSSPRSP